MEARTKVAAVIALLTAAAMTSVVACDDSGSNAVKEPRADSGPTPGIDSGTPPGTDGGTLPDGAPADCFTNPKTHFEIINACTDAVKIAKNPTLPLLYPDGGLPPLP
jgi:hypothetical protein